MDPLYGQFRERVQAAGLITAGDSVVVAYSGGKDSTALLHLLLLLRDELGFRLRAAYFNHRLREDADAEEIWVRRACDRLGVELEVGGRDVRRYRDQARLNLEQAASLSRYRFLAAVADREPGTLIATAHTRSDLLETFFIKLFRGSGLQGLTAVHQRKYRRIVRPLLLFGEAEIRAFLERHGLAYYRDPTNLDVQFTRNRIRLELLPRVRELEPAVEERVLQTVGLLQEEFDFFAGEAQRLLHRHLLVERILPAAAFSGLHLAMRRHLAREYLRRIKGDLIGVGYRHVEEFLGCLDSGRGLSLPGGDLRFDKGWVRPHGTTVPIVRQAIAAPGRVGLPELGCALVISPAGRFRKPGRDSEILVSQSLLRFPLTLRSANRDDRYLKMNAAWSQAVYETIRVAGYPADLRFLCPVLENGDRRIIWVAHAPIADEFKVRDREAGPFWRIRLG